nr:immunoglobulin heavy chain junction region [Mus musculus]
YYCAILGLFD